jgi:hypothetical protein
MGVVIQILILLFLFISLELIVIFVSMLADGFITNTKLVVTPMLTSVILISALYICKVSTLCSSNARLAFMLFLHVLAAYASAYLVKTMLFKTQSTNW